VFTADIQPTTANHHGVVVWILTAIYITAILETRQKHPNIISRKGSKVSNQMKQDDAAKQRPRSEKKLHRVRVARVHMRCKGR
jgi:hypothetical protein